MALRTLIFDQHTVLLLDFRGCKEGEMIDIVHLAREKALEINKPIKLLSIYDSKNFITPRFMSVVEEKSVETIHLIEKQAVVGLTPVKKLILKGYNFLLKRNIQNFDNEKDALEFLLNPNTSDKLNI